MRYETFEWMTRARCHALDPELFFPSDSTGVMRAQRICASCEVADACLAYALDHNLDHGVWGGKSERERRKLRRARRLDHQALQGIRG